MLRAKLVECNPGEYLEKPSERQFKSSRSHDEKHQIAPEATNTVRVNVANLISRFNIPTVTKAGSEL